MGGGALIVPLLVGAVKLPQHLAHGTSLVIVFCVASAGLIGYVTSGNIDWPLAGVMAAGSMVGAYAGAKTMARVSPLRLRQVFGLFLLAVAIRMFIV